MSIRAILLDFDGLILDTETPELEAWQEIYASHGFDFPLGSWLDTIGRGADDIRFDPYADLEARSGRSLDTGAIRAAKRARFLTTVDQQRAMPGVEELLQEASARGVKLGVASSSAFEWVGGYIERLGLKGYFESFQCLEVGRKGKPHPELYLRLLESLDVRPDEAVALEDSPNGVKAARAAGIFCIAIPNQVTRLLDLGHASARFDSLAGISLDTLLNLPGTARL